jgi:hypothetical protein
VRITPNLPRLRVVALGCWAIGAWCVIYGSRLVIARPAITLLIVGVELLALLLFAIGVAFWQLSNDKRAGIVFDAKGLLLNLGHSSAFIAWNNIERVGTCAHRANVLTVGSRRQLGIALRDVRPYVQSYEERLPAAQGVIARGLRLIESLLRPYRQVDDRPLTANLAANRAQTGYDVLVPETLLGGDATAFAELVETYQLRPSARQILESFG